MNVGESELLRGLLKTNTSDPCQNLSPPLSPSCLTGLVASLQRGATFSRAATQTQRLLAMGDARGRRRLGSKVANKQ